MSDEQTVQSFTSWKLDAFDLLRCDRKLNPMQRLIGQEILQHVNRQRMTAELSVDRIAAGVGIARENANRHITKLVARGWFTSARCNGNGATTYRFAPTEAIASPVIEARDFRRERAKEAMNRRYKQFTDVTQSSPPKPLDVTKPSRADVTISYKADVTQSSPKHLRYNHLHITPKEEGMEGEGSSNEYALASRGAA